MVRLAHRAFFKPNKFQTKTLFLTVLVIHTDTAVLGSTLNMNKMGGGKRHSELAGMESPSPPEMKTIWKPPGLEPCSHDARAAKLQSRIIECYSDHYNVNELL
jgi:hypothetical protein